MYHKHSIWAQTHSLDISLYFLILIYYTILCFYTCIILRTSTAKLFCLSIYEYYYSFWCTLHLSSFSIYETLFRSLCNVPPLATSRSQHPHVVACALILSNLNLLSFLFESLAWACHSKVLQLIWSFPRPSHATLKFCPSIHVPHTSPTLSHALRPSWHMWDMLQYVSDIRLGCH